MFACEGEYRPWSQVASELWGLKHHGANYMLFDGVTSVFGTLGMAKFVTQSVYAANIEEAGGRVCRGRGCFQPSARPSFC